jgi:Zn-dependent M28 family amino/carboxypeptidase
MKKHNREESLCLMEHIKALENQNSSARGQYIQQTLKRFEIKSVTQNCNVLQIKNIIVDFSSGFENKHLIISAHYDVVKGSPGANDNASGVSVLLGLCQELRDIKIPVKIVFFDREEAWIRTPLLRLGLLGSLYYAYTTNLRNISAVYNLEFCGAGDCLAIWPIGHKENTLSAFRQITVASDRIGLPYKSAYIPWMLMSSDHLSFRLRGFPNVLTLSLLPSDGIKAIEKTLAGTNLYNIVFRHRPIMPEPLSVVHTSKDTSSNLNENSLNLVLKLLIEVIREHASPVGNNSL